MGVHNLGSILPQLRLAGLAEDTPIALIRWGTCPAQQELIGTFATILEQIQTENFDAPAIVVIGNVVNYPAEIAKNLIHSD